MNKKELLEALESGREKFLDALEGIPEDAWELPGVAGEWSLKDLLAHLSRWEAEMIKLLWQAQHGQRPDTAPFSGKSIDEINATWHKESQDRPLERVLEDFQAVRNQTILRVEGFSDRDLTDPKRYAWSPGKALWVWVENDSFGHEEEHLPDVLRWKAMVNRQ